MKAARNTGVAIALLFTEKSTDEGAFQKKSNLRCTFIYTFSSKIKCQEYVAVKARTHVRIIKRKYPVNTYF